MSYVGAKLGKNAIDCLFLNYCVKFGTRIWYALTLIKVNLNQYSLLRQTFPAWYLTSNQPYNYYRLTSEF